MAKLMKNPLESTNITKTLYSLSPDKKTILSYPTNADNVILLAVSELQKYLKKISGITATVTLLMDALGQRTLDGNICASSEEGLGVIAKNAIDFIEKNSRIENLNVWGEDIWGRSWCYCPECSSLPPQDQYMIACNAIAQGIKKARRLLKLYYGCNLIAWDSPDFNVW